LNAWSPTLATLIKDSCGLLESTLKHISPTSVKIENKNSKREKLKIGDLGYLYARKLGLAERKVILLHPFSSPEYRNPFDVWKTGRQRKDFDSPPWWTTYNKLKHDELKCIERATTNAAIDALAGLILTIGTTPELTRALMRSDLLYWKNVEPGRVVSWALGGFAQERPVIVKTGLFALVLGGKPLPDDIDSFRPLYDTQNQVLVPYFG
jgi:hypothetical protein